MQNKKIKILIIEDDSFLLGMYAAKFNLEKFEVILAEDGEKGLMLAFKELPDVILLDIFLPKKNGFDVLKELKGDESAKKIPVILLTNLSQKSEIEQGLSLGAADYLIKAHFMPSEVVEKVKKTLTLKSTN
ncbi:response regulator [Patescibacteria group bacterium]|nr:response regulator [Candidatus Falkowbacteria bacterium]MBU3906316.1 response regulator [Patescibacteria group bacterium]MCG2698275.1 response regulator [Candidatus Parcubacteria bacterium]MBU4015599.1 response regulator [Patescibacteria group bacterium]MBU4027135.1 response regulator [Patescibacteria group bacterium]